MPRAEAKTVEGACGNCGCPVVANRKRSDPARLCCRSAVCDAVMNWTLDEWRARAHCAARRPDVTPGQRLDWPTSGWCWCAGHDDPTALATFVVRVDGVRWMLAAACPRCTGVPGEPWWDDPRSTGGNPYRWIDHEALRRHPDAAEAAGWSLRSVDDGEVRRVHEAAPAPPEVQPVAAASGRDVAHNPPPDMAIISEPPAAVDKPEVSTSPVEPPEWAGRPRAGDLALIGGELVPIRAVELPDGSHEILNDDGTVAVVVQAPPPAPAAPIVPVAAPGPARAAHGGARACLVAECDSKQYTSRCGRTSNRRKGDCLPDHGMTGWGSLVTCPACVAAAAEVRAAA